jgi:Flp pilus assembly protein TadD
MGTFKRVLVCVLTVFLIACTTDPNKKKQKYFQSGEQYFAKQNYRAALIEYANALRIDADFEEARYKSAVCYARLGMVYPQAYQELLRAVTLKPDDLKAQVMLGNIFLASRQFARAQQTAETILNKDRNNTDGHILLANSYAGLGNVETSLREMQDAIGLAPDRSSSYLNMAELQLHAKDSVQAEANFKKAVELDPKSAGALMALGNFYAQQRRFAEAEANFQKALQLQPKDAIPRAALAKVYFVQGQKDKAVQVLTDAKKAAPDDPGAYRMLGDFYFVTGALNQAVTEYQSILRAHPRDPISKSNLTQLLIFKGDLNSAASLNDQFLKDDPKDVRGLILRGEILIGQGKPNDAVEPLQTALKSEPDNALGHYYLGMALLGGGDEARAQSEWQEALRLRPRMIEAQRALANLAIRRGNLQLLTDSAAALVEDEPNSPEGYVFRAMATFGRGDETGAEADLQKAISLAPNSPVPYGQLAGLRLRQKRYSDAEKLYQQALDRGPQYFDALQGLVMTYGAQNELPKAVAAVQTQIQKVPNDPAYYRLLGGVLLDSGQHGAARAAVEKALALNDKDTDSYLLMVKIFTDEKRPDQVLTTAQHWVQQSPKDPRAYLELGVVQDRQGNWQDAEQSYQKALQVSPDYAPAANNLAYLMLQHDQNPDEALSYVQTARRGLPQNAQVDDTLGLAYYKKGSYELAVSTLEGAAKKDPQDPSIHYHLGLACGKVNRRDCAKSELQRALKLNPNGPQAGEVKEALEGASTQ